MVRVFSSEVEVAGKTFEALISVFSRPAGTAFVINIKDLQVGSGAGEEFQKLLAEEISFAISRVQLQLEPPRQMRAV